MLTHVRNVVVSNGKGTSLGAPLHIGIEGAALSGVEQIHDVLVPNCSFGSSGEENAGFMSVNMPFDLMVIRDCVYVPTVPYAVVIIASIATAGTLELQNFKMLRNPDGNQAPPFVSLQNCTLNKLVLDISVEDVLGSSYTAIPSVLTATGSFTSGSGSTVNQLIVDRIDMTHITEVVDSTFGGSFAITSVAGTGVLGTGWLVPDAQVANNTLYVSATSGMPSIKVADVAHAL